MAHPHEQVPGQRALAGQQQVGTQAPRHRETVRQASCPRVLGRKRLASGQCHQVCCVTLSGPEFCHLKFKGMPRQVHLEHRRGARPCPQGRQT